MVHEVNISYAFFEFFIAYVVDGVQKLIFRACGFRDGFAHLFIGHLDVEYDGNMVFLHLIHEEGNSCRILRCLRLKIFFIFCVMMAILHSLRQRFLILHLFFMQNMAAVTIQHLQHMLLHLQVQIHIPQLYHHLHH